MRIKPAQAERDVRRAAVRMAGEGLGAFVGDLGVKELLKQKGGWSLEASSLVEHKSLLPS